MSALCFYPSSLLFVFILYFQTKRGVLPAGVLHTSLSVFEGTLHLQAQQPFAALGVHHNAVGTGGQPWPPRVNEQTAWLDGDRVTQGGALQSLQDDIISTIINLFMKLEVNVRCFHRMAVPGICGPPLPLCQSPSSWLWSGLSGPHLFHQEHQLAIFTGPPPRNKHV